MSGISSSGSSITSGAVLLSDARDGVANVILHVVNSEVASHWNDTLDNWFVLAADLAEHHRPREVARAAQIVREGVERHSMLQARRSRTSEYQNQIVAQDPHCTDPSLTRSRHWSTACSPGWWPPTPWRLK